MGPVHEQLGSPNSDGVSWHRKRIPTGELSRHVDDILDGSPTRSTVKMSEAEREGLLAGAIRRLRHDGTRA